MTRTVQLLDLAAEKRGRVGGGGGGRRGGGGGRGGDGGGGGGRKGSGVFTVMVIFFLFYHFNLVHFPPPPPRTLPALAYSALNTDTIALSNVVADREGMTSGIPTMMTL